MTTYSLTRYRLKAPPLPGQLADEFLTDCLAKNVFIPIDELPESYSLGWVEHFNHFASNFNPATYRFGGSIALSMRFDSRNVTGKTVCRYFAICEAQYFEAKGRKPKGDIRRELKESVKADLTRKAAVDTEIIKVYWHQQQNEVWLMAQGVKKRERFETLWNRTFGLPLEMQVPFSIALGIDSEAASRLEINQDKSFLDKWESTKWLGRDFLLWLWTESEIKNNVFNYPNLTCEVWLDGKITLADDEGVITCASSKPYWPEGQAAVLEGKKPVKARLCIRDEECTFNLTMDSDLILSSIRLPKTFADSEEEIDTESGHMLENLYLLNRLCDSIDELFAVYMKIRFDQKHWNEEVLPSIRDWAGGAVKLSEEKAVFMKKVQASERRLDFENNGLPQ